MQKIFISYSRKDVDFVRRLAGDLEKATYDVWWDVSDLRGGDEWVTRIASAIQDSATVLVVLSPNSLESQWVRKEYTQAIGLGKRLIPVMYSPVPMPFALNTINYVNFASGDYADNLNSLLGALGYSGEPIQPSSNLPFTLRKYAIPILIGLGFLLTLGSFLLFSPTPSPTVTPTTSPAPTTPVPATVTETSVSTDSPTPSATLTATATATIPTSTPTATLEVVESLPFCISRDIARRFTAVYVRTGPDDTYAPFEDVLLTKNSRTQNPQCLTFSAMHENGLWLLIADDQTDPDLQKFEGGWMRRDLLAAGVSGSINLPVFTLTPTPTPTNTPTITPSLTRTPTLTLSNTPTFTRTPSPTPTDTPTLTPSPTDTPSPTETETSTPTETPKP